MPFSTVRLPPSHTDPRSASLMNGISAPPTMLPYADLLLHLTEWHQFSDIDPKRLATRTASPKVIDARGTPRRRSVARNRLDVPVSRPCPTNTPIRE
ncbi:hypothetical protein ACF053_27625 [Streptomyces kanasensis]|uniref:hypothetical protein n=1 Tax=Streptomyces kanasensis TaxID=936756 RepID=UPI0036FFC694